MYLIVNIRPCCDPASQHTSKHAAALAVEAINEIFLHSTRRRSAGSHFCSLFLEASLNLSLASGYILVLHNSHLTAL